MIYTLKYISETYYYIIALIKYFNISLEDLKNIIYEHILLRKDKIPVVSLVFLLL